MARWVETALGDVCHVYQPLTLAQKQLRPGPFPVYGANGQIGWHDEFNHEDVQLLLGCRGSVGFVHFTTDRAWINGNAMVVVPKEGVMERDFLAYALRGGVDLTSSITGAAQPQITRASLTPIPIAFPSDLAEQRRIVSILDEAFKGIATAKANAEKNLGNAREVFESHLQALFSPGQDGWGEQTLGETYDVRDGTHDSPKYHNSGFPLITSKNLKRDGLSFDDVKLISETDYRKINERSAVHKGDVLLAMIGTIGNPNVVEVEPDFAIKNVALLKVPKGQNGYFLRHYLSSQSVVEKMQSEAKGTTQKFVGLGYLRAFPIPVPDASEQARVVRQMEEISTETDRLEEIYTRKLAALEELKKSLLHRAFSGEL